MSGAMTPPVGGQMPPQVMQALMAQRQQQGGGGGPAPVPQMPQGMPQGIPPQVMQALMAQRQQQQQGGGGAPQGVPQGMPQQPQIIPPVVGGAAAQNPNLALFGKAAQMQPGQGAQPGQQPRLSTSEMARLGRFGDQVVAHLAPGEIAVPPELQTPKVLATLNQAFKSVGVSPQQFTAGSGANTHNPATGAPEFSLLGALLPIIGAVGGSFIPGIGTAAGMALGGALGGAAGGLVDHTGGMGTLLGAAGGAAGGYLGGSGGIGSLLGSGASGAAGAAGAAGSAGAAGAAAANTAPFGAMAADLPSAGAGGATMAGAGPLGTAATAPGMTLMQRLMGGLTAGTGASLASGFAPTPTTNSTPPGFNTPMHPLNTNYGGILGSGQSNQPFFNGYNPYQAVMGPNPGYRFYPTS